MTQQEQINSLCECVEGLTDAMEQEGKSRDILVNVLEFEGLRIDSLAKKIDLLMESRADELEAEAEKRRKEYHKSERERW